MGAVVADHTKKKKTAQQHSGTHEHTEHTSDRQHAQRSHSSQHHTHSRQHTQAGGIADGTRTNGPWTHTSGDNYIYHLSLVLATATISLLKGPT